MNIDKLPAGPEIDWLIASKIFDWSKNEFQVAAGGILGGRENDFSTNMARAWEVLGPFTDMAYPVSVIFTHPTEDEPWACTIGEKSAFGETAALAICRAALKEAGA